MPNDTTTKASYLNTASGHIIVSHDPQFVTIRRQVGEGYVTFTLPRLEAGWMAQEILEQLGRREGT